MEQWWMRWRWWALAALLAVTFGGIGVTGAMQQPQRADAAASGRNSAGPLSPAATSVVTDDPVPGSCFAQLELALVLDGSFSIAEPDFVVVRNFAALTVSALQVRPGGGVRTGIVQFSSQGTARVEADLSDDPFILGSRIFGMPQIQQETDIQEGVELGQRLLLSQARPGIQQVMVVFTDGRDNEPGDLARQAEDARTACIFLIAVGVGPDIDLDQLNSIASAGQVFTPATYPELLGLVGQLVTEFCPPTDARGELTFPTPSTKLGCGPQTFSWTPGVNAIGYRLIVGSRAGMDDLFSYSGLDTSARWGNPPEDGRVLFVTLTTVFRSQAQSLTYVFAACNPPCPMCMADLDLALTLTANPRAAAPNAPFTVTAEVRNIGNLAAQDATVTINAANNFRFFQLNPRITGANCSAPSQQVNSITCTGLNIPPGGTATITIQATVLRDAPINCMTFNGETRAAASQTDRNLGNNTATTSVGIQRGASPPAC